MKPLMLNSNYSLALASPYQEAEILEIAKKAIANGNFPDNSFSEEKLIQVIKLMTVSMDGIVILLLHEDKIVGVFMGCAAEHPYLSFKQASQIFWYVDEDHRGKHSLKMLEAYENWATIMGCRMVANSHYPEDEKIEKVYKRFGYKATDVYYTKELK